MQPRLSRSIAWTLSGTFVFALSQWALVALTAKLAGSAALGSFTLAAAVVAPILALTQVQLRAVLATDARFEHRLRDFFDVRGWLTLGMVLVTPLIALVTQAERTTVGVISTFVLAKAFDSLADVLYGYHQRREDMRVIAIGQYVNGVLSVALFGGVLLVTQDIVAATAGYAAASFLALISWAVPMTVRARRTDTEDPRDQAPDRLRLLRSALPLGIVMVLAGLSANLPRYAVQGSMGESALGFYGGAAYLILVGSNVITAIGQAASPRLAKYAAASKPSSFRRLLGRLIIASVLLGAAGTVISLVWGAPLLKVFYTGEFARHNAVLVALAAGAMLSFPASILAVAATATRSFRAQMPVFVVVLIAGLVACALSVPAWGLMGAALATAVMSLVQLIGCAWIVRASMPWYGEQAARALRVAHVVGRMNRAGVETWLMNVARRTDPAHVEMTFIVHSVEPSDYDDEIRALGHRIAVVANPHRPVRYMYRLVRLLRGGSAPFGAIHSHVGHFSAVPLAAAWLARVPVRIAHSHSDSRTAQRMASPARHAYFAVAAAAIRAFATTGLASSEGACQSLFRRQTSSDGRFRVLPTGIDLEPYATARGDLRAELGISHDTLILGHIGRFVPVKNHELLVAIAAQLPTATPRAHLVLVGDGPLRAQVEQEVADVGAAEYVSVLGLREDVPVLLSEFDVLLLPSHYEGVPIVLLEAQASGCPCLVSANVSSASDVVPGLLARLEVEDPASVWLEAALRIAREPRDGELRAAAQQLMRSSEYNVEVTVETLHELWFGGPRRA